MTACIEEGSAVHGPKDMTPIARQTKLSGLKATLDLTDDLLKIIISDYFHQRGYSMVTKQHVRFGVSKEFGAEYPVDKAWAKVDLVL